MTCTNRIAAQASTCHRTGVARPSSAPTTGAVSACVSGTLNRTGPISAIVWSVAATLAP